MANIDVDSLPIANKNLYTLCINKANGTIKKFAEMLGVPPQNLDRVFRIDKRNGKYPQLPSTIIQAVKDKYGLDEAWLYSEHKTIESTAVPFVPERHVMVPVVSAYARAGYITGYADPEYLQALPTIDFTPDHEMHGHYVAFEIKGDSMDDGSKESYIEGELVICREVGRHLWQNDKLHIHKRDFVIVCTDGILIKRIEEHDVAAHTITIHSLNPEYPDRTIDLAEVLQIFSVVESRIQRKR